MDKATVIALARQAEGEEQQHGMWRMHVEDLERFAALIHDHLTYSSVHSCHPGCTKPACVAMREAVLAEREECAKVCEDYDTGQDLPFDKAVIECAAAIRSRNEAW